MMGISMPGFRPKVESFYYWFQPHPESQGRFPGRLSVWTLEELPDNQTIPQHIDLKTLGEAGAGRT